ncbi:hypothetical protein Taro_024384 [Colocasia esculenta]|uniref:Uncharacterized protein n=1 Tax=Colocasia esculenta TaxID=4460 RepID=A0A843VK71_COLES|nr:hypothetical protein [Colocasia esculenta]
MNDGGSSPGEGELGMHPVAASGNEARVTLESGARRPRRGMDADAKRKPGALAEAAGGESDDDETPIRSLLKMKRPRFSKKFAPSTPEATTMGDSRAEEATLVEIDDTLASMRKKLKNPKRVRASISGSGDSREKESTFVDKAGDMQGSLEHQGKKSSPVSTKRNAEQAIAGPLDDVRHSSDDGLEDSISAFFKKAHRASARKSGPKRKRQAEETVGSVNRIKETANAILASPKSAPCGETACPTAEDTIPVAKEASKKLAPKKRGRKSHDRSDVEPKELNCTEAERTADDETLRESNVPLGRRRGGRRAVNNHSSVPTRMKGNSQKLSSSVSIEGSGGTMVSGADTIGWSSEENVEVSLPETLNSVCSLNKKDKSATLQKNRSQTTQRGHVHDVDLKQTSIGTMSKGVPSAPVQETSCSSIMQMLVEETQSLNGLKHCSHGKFCNPLSATAELSEYPVSRKTEEIQDFEPNVETEESLQEVSHGNPLTSAVIAQPSEDLPREPSGASFHGKAEDGSIHVKRTLGGSLTSSDYFYESSGYLVGKDADVLLNNNHLNGSTVEVKEEIVMQDDSASKLEFDMSGKRCPLSTSDTIKSAGLNGSQPFVHADCTSIVVRNSQLAEVSCGETAVADIMDKPFEGHICLLPHAANNDELPVTHDICNQFPRQVSEAHEQSGNSSGSPPSVLVHDNLTVVEANSTGSQAVTPIPEEFPADDVAVLPKTDLCSIEKQKVPPRATRKAKRHKYGDMAYEGDADWEVLMHGVQSPFGNTSLADDEQFTRGTYKFDSAVNVDPHDGGLAAVAAGLKAHAVGPIEKIKFKDVLKCKGGLQDYLACR